MTQQTIYTVKQVTDDLTIETISGSVDMGAIMFNNIPRAKFIVTNSGVEMFKLDNGKEIEIRRGKELIFTGVVETLEGSKELNKHNLVSVTCVQKFYHILRRVGLYSYDFDEDGKTSTTRDGVTINPNQYIILRDIDGVINDYGDYPGIAGVSADEVLTDLIGTNFVFQHLFEDDSLLLNKNTSEGLDTITGLTINSFPGFGSQQAQSITITQDCVTKEQLSFYIEKLPEDRATSYSNNLTISLGTTLDYTSGISAINVDLNNYFDVSKNEAGTKLITVDFPSTKLTPGTWYLMFEYTGVSAPFPLMANMTDVYTNGQAFVGTTGQTFDWGIKFTTTSLTSSVYIDSLSGDKLPRLQRSRYNDQFLPSGKVETIPLVNNQFEIHEMDDITEVTIELIGEKNTTNDVLVEVRRDALLGTGLFNTDKSNYNSVTLTPSAIGATGLTKWTGTYVFSGSETTKNALSLRIDLNESLTTTDTNKLYYFKTNCTLDNSDITIGTIDTYLPEDIAGLNSDEKTFIEIDLLGFNRLDAIEEIRKHTISSEASNTSPHWDAWVNNLGEFSFKENRGVTTNKEYSFKEENITKVSHEYYGGEIAYQTIAYGAGSGVAQTRIVAKEEYSTGGLYDSDRDPKTPGALFNGMGRVLRFIDSNELSAVSLLSKARSFHKLNRKPVESVVLNIISEHIPYFELGDNISIKEYTTRTDQDYRVIEFSRTWSSDKREGVSIRLGEPVNSFTEHLKSNVQDAQNLTIKDTPDVNANNVSGNGIYFDKDTYGLYNFSIPDGTKIDRVYLNATTLPWQTNIKEGINTLFSDTDTGLAQVSKTTSLTETGLIEVYGLTETEQLGLELKLKAQNFGSNNVEIKTATIHVRLEINEESGGAFSTVLDDYIVMEMDASAQMTTRLDYLLTGKQLLSMISNNLYSYRLTIDSDTEESVTLNSEYHIEIVTQGSQFGINRFTDTNNDTIYTKNARISIDPSTQLDNIPNNNDFIAKEHGITIGNETNTMTYRLDITGLLSVNSEGVIETGSHKVWVAGIPTTLNPSALGVIDFNVEYKLKQ